MSEPRKRAALTPEETAPGTGRRALVGAVASVPAWRAAARASAPARLARRVGAALERARPTRRLAGLIAVAHNRAVRALGRLVVLGEEEERRDRAMASAAVQEIFDATCARLAESEAIRRLVREQTTGLTASAIATVRRWSANADDALERALSRATRVFRPGSWRRRRRRLVPAESAP